MASLYGTVGPFNDEEETWTQYVERLEQYFIANEVEDDKKQRAIFLSVCGPKTYALLRDLLQPKKPSETEREMFLVVIDAYSKWLEEHLMKSTTSTNTIGKLREIFATHGLPATVVSDNGTNFTSDEFREFMQVMESSISQVHPTTLHPMARRKERFGCSRMAWRK